MNDEVRIPVFFSESDLLLVIEILQAAERGDLRQHETEKAMVIGALADKLIEAGQRIT